MELALNPVAIGPSHPISEIATSRVCRLKNTRNKGDLKKFFFNQVSEGKMSDILSVIIKWLGGCAVRVGVTKNRFKSPHFNGTICHYSN